MNINFLLPDNFQQLVVAIEQAKTMSSEELVKAIAEAGWKADDFMSLSRFSHLPEESYGRNKIYEGRAFSIYLMSWAPGDFTAIHNHGCTDWGAVCFLNNIDHRLYQTKDNKIILAEKGVIPQGSIVPVSGALTHAMGNLSDTPALSLHIYGSNKGMSNANDETVVYEMEKQRCISTTGVAFLNGDEQWFKQITPGVETNEETLLDYFEILLPFYRRINHTEMVNYLEKAIRQVLQQVSCC